MTKATKNHGYYLQAPKLSKTLGAEAPIASIFILTMALLNHLEQGDLVTIFFHHSLIDLLRPLKTVKKLSSALEIFGVYIFQFVHFMMISDLK